MLSEAVLNQFRTYLKSQVGSWVERGRKKKERMTFNKSLPRALAKDLPTTYEEIASFALPTAVNAEKLIK